MGLRVLCWGTYDTGKPRTRILLQGMRAAGLDVSECHAHVWHEIEDKSQVQGTLRRLVLGLRWLASYPRLLWRFMRVPRPDLVLIGFPGVLDVIALAPLARLRGVPLVWDMFMSLYDTVVVDRRMLKPTSMWARVLHALEGFAIRRCELVFLDTAAHARYVESLFGLPRGQSGEVWVGAELEHFAPLPPAADRAPEAPLRVLFYGQFIPLHGIPTIIEAARETESEPIEWTLIGRGQEARDIADTLKRHPLRNLRWVEWVSYAELRKWIERSDVCLGIFGTSAKAASVVPNKVFQIVAAGRPLVTRDSPAIRELLGHAPPCSYLVPPADPQALAQAIRMHARSARVPRCHVALTERISADSIGRQFVQLIETRLQFVTKHEARDVQ